jgi:hypothetical protein
MRSVSFSIDEGDAKASGRVLGDDGEARSR